MDVSPRGSYYLGYAFKLDIRHGTQVMCPHIFKTYQSHLQNHLGQNNLIKVHTPYLKDYQIKDPVNVPKQKYMSPDLK